MFRYNRKPLADLRRTGRARRPVGSLVGLVALTFAAGCVGDGVYDETGGQGVVDDRRSPGSDGTDPSPTSMGGDDACPGARIEMDLGHEIVVAGDTSVATDDYRPSCSVDRVDGPDVAFDLALAGSGVLTARLVAKGATHAPALIVRAANTDPKQCEVDEGVLVCLSSWKDQASWSHDVGPNAPSPFDEERLTLIVDGGSPGPYELSLSFAPPACGDGISSASIGEECDDGNVEPFDGCSPTCTIEPDLAGDRCGDPAMPVLAVEPHYPVLVRSATWGAANDYAHVPGLEGQACATESAGGVDRVVPFTPTESGSLKVSIGLSQDGFGGACEDDGLATPLCWDAVLYVAGPNQCDLNGDGTLGNEQLACSDAATLGLETVTFEVVAGQEYYAVVEPSSAAAAPGGPFNLRFDLDVTPQPMSARHDHAIDNPLGGRSRRDR